MWVDNVTATVPGSRVPVLKNIQCHITPGSIVALIGPSGSGKSTLARLLVGVWPAGSGCVRLDGADIYQWNKQELGAAVGYLPQDVELFAGTIAENIARFGEAQAELIVEAAKLAGVHELILQMPQGYDTLLGDNGAGLSGGQKQRIVLARALYNKPALVVLDEPNANLDEAGDMALVQALHQLKEQQCTVVLVSHKQSVLQAATHILALHNGQVRAFGTVADVIAERQKQAQASNVAYARPATARVQNVSFGDMP